MHYLPQVASQHTQQQVNISGQGQKLLTSFFQLGFLYFHGLYATAGTLGSTSDCQRLPKI